MKTKKVVEVECCDVCGKEANIHCIICNKVFCYNCHKIATKEFRISINAANTESICNDCLNTKSLLSDKQTQILSYIQQIGALIIEEDSIYKEFRKKAKVIHDKAHEFNPKIFLKF